MEYEDEDEEATNVTYWLDHPLNIEINNFLSVLLLTCLCLRLLNEVMTSSRSYFILGESMTLIAFYYVVCLSLPSSSTWEENSFRAYFIN